MSANKKADAESLRELIRTFVRLFGLLDQSRTPCGLSMAVSDAYALAELLSRPGIEPLELSRRLGLTKSAVSRLLIRLKKRRQIRQIRSKVDGRVYNLHLTETGRQAASMIDRESLKTFVTIISRLPDDAVEQLLQNLPLLIEALPRSRQYFHSNVVQIGHDIARED